MFVARITVIHSSESISCSYVAHLRYLIVVSDALNALFIGSERNLTLVSSTTYGTGQENQCIYSRFLWP
jgi:hypothetical protein